MDKEETENEKFENIEDVIEFLQKYMNEVYVEPEPNYYIRDGKILHLVGHYKYDKRVYDLYPFLIEKGYIDTQKADEDSEKHVEEWKNFSNWDIDKLNYNQLNFYIVRLYQSDRINEGLIYEHVRDGRLLKIVELIKQYKEKEDNL